MKKINARPWKNVDLHSHSQFSDGTFTPEELALRAQNNHLDLWALTDHDTLEGIVFAQNAAKQHNIDFVAGVEISCLFEGQSVHIVGLDVDIHNPLLQNGISQVRNTRLQRAKKMSAELEKVGIANAFEGAMQFCNNPNTISRAHFARYLVQIGKAKNTSAVFESYLEVGKPGYVAHQWAQIEEAILWIQNAKGIAVLAHPGRYTLSKSAQQRLLERFKENGGKALEIASAAHSADEIRHWANIALHYGFLGSVGSDFHDLDERHRDLGKAPALPENVRAVWELWEH